jgi:hypothetical protein
MERAIIYIHIVSLKTLRLTVVEYIARIFSNNPTKQTGTLGTNRNNAATYFLRVFFKTFKCGLVGRSDMSHPRIRSTRSEMKLNARPNTKCQALPLGFYRLK